MSKAGGIIALIAGIFGTFAAGITLFLGGVGGAIGRAAAASESYAEEGNRLVEQYNVVVWLGWGGVAFSFLTIVLGAVAIGAKSKTPAVLLILCAIGGAILGGTLVAIFMALALIGGVIALFGETQPPPRRRSSATGFTLPPIQGTGGAFQPGPEQTSRSQFCKNCGQRLDPAQRFCGGCGAEQSISPAFNIPSSVGATGETQPFQGSTQTPLSTITATPSHQREEQPIPLSMPTVQDRPRSSGGRAALIVGVSLIVAGLSTVGAIFAMGGFGNTQGTASAQLPPPPHAPPSGQSQVATESPLALPTPESPADRKTYNPTKATFQQQGSVVVGIGGISNLDQTATASSDDTGCIESGPCRGLSVRIIAYATSADSRGSIIAMEAAVVSPDGKRIPTNGSATEADQDEYGWSSDDVFRVDDAWFDLGDRNVDQIVANGGWRIEVMIGDSKFDFPLTAIGEHFPTLRRDSFRYAHVVDVASNDVLNVRAGPTAQASAIGELKPDAGNLEIISCINGPSLDEWIQTTRAGRKAGSGWCLTIGQAMIPQSQSTARVLGWVNPRYLASRN